MSMLLRVHLKTIIAISALPSCCLLSNLKLDGMHLVAVIHQEKQVVRHRRIFFLGGGGARGVSPPPLISADLGIFH